MFFPVKALVFYVKFYYIFYFILYVEIKQSKKTEQKLVGCSRA